MAISDADRFAGLIDAPPRDDSGPEELHGAAGYAPASGETAELLTLVSALRAMDFDIGPSDQTRRRQRQRLVAMAAVRISEAPEEGEAGRHRAFDSAIGTDRAGSWSQVLARIRQVQSGRRLIAALAGLSVVVAALGILSLLAQSAIPGDTLYALKRGTEQARLVMADDEQAEGRVLLGFASTRLDELVALLDEPVSFSATGAGVQAADGSDVSELLVNTMETMDRQTTDGTHSLTTAAIGNGSLPTLQFIGEWGIDQFSGLDELTGQMPQEARDRAEESKDLLQRVVERLEILAQAIDCDCPENLSNSDELGPLPCPRCSDSDENGSPSASGPTASSGGGGSAPSSSSDASTTTAERSSDPSGSSDPSDESAPPVPPNPLPNPIPDPGPTRPAPIPIPDPIPIPTQSVPPVVPPSPPVVPPPAPPPPSPPAPPTDPNEGQPCVLIGFLGIEIPGIITGGVCVGLGG